MGKRAILNKEGDFMNTEKFTQKSIEAINKAASLAKESGNQQITGLHLAAALLSDEEGLIKKLVESMGVSVPRLTAALNGAIDKLPKVSGAGGEYMSNDFASAISSAEKKAAEMKDEFTSVEHLFYGLIDKPSRELENIFSDFNVDKDAFLKVLLKVQK